MNIVLHMVFLVGVVDYTFTQFITVGSNSRRPGKATCDNSSKSALVEQFFNIIFNEFHTAPPVCVCVQMCPDQPTYCYPNGCMKRAETKKAEIPLPVTHISENSKPIFLLEPKNDFMRELLNKNYVDENKAAPVLGMSKQANIMPINLRPDPFKDRYKILFRYKKMPKVELKYNLGEQVKNMKSEVLRKDNVDVSKTRWPLNKINSNRVTRQRMYSDAQGSEQFFMTTLSEKEVAHYPPKYFKRELVNTTNNYTGKVDVKSVDTMGITELENNSYSLEKIIDSLIESSFEANKTLNVSKQNNTKIIKEVTTETSDKNSETTEAVITLGNVTKPVVTTSAPQNNTTYDTTHVISINFTSENNDKNKYFETDVINNTNVMSKMIASLSKKIEIQNNTSLEMVRRMVGNFDYNSISDKLVEQSTLKENVEIVTMRNTKRSADNYTRTTKKGRQRLGRKLQNSKNN